MNLTDRDIRQRDILPPDKLKEIHAMVVGVGAIGRQVALALATIGVGQLVLVDFDTVGVENMAAQGYRPEQINSEKVFVTHKDCRLINEGVEVCSTHERFREELLSDYNPNILFCCVDDMEVRRLIFEAYQNDDGVKLFIDARMAAMQCRVLTHDKDMPQLDYPATLFDQGEAYVGSCTAKTTFFCANIAAGLMVNQMAQWIRRFPLTPDFELNLAAMELTVAS